MRTLRDTTTRRKAIAAAITALTAAAVVTASPSARAQENLTGLALSGGGSFLFNFNTANPSNVSNYTLISGLNGYSLEDIDYRPTAATPSLNGVLYGLGKSAIAGSSSFNLSLFTIGTTVGTSANNFGQVLSSTLLSGATFGPGNYSIDFNPAANALRIVSDQGADYRIPGANLATNPAAVVVDGPLTLNGIAAPGILGAAYTNNFGGAGATTLYQVSYTNANDTLYLQNPPNNGVLTPVGTNLGVDLALGGFDISGVTGNAYYGGGNNLYQINLATGTAASLGNFGFNPNVATVRGIAAQVGTAAPEPGSLALIGTGILGMVGGFARRRRQK